MILEQQPLGEAEPVFRQGFRQRRQDVGRVGLHFVLAFVVLAAVENVGLGHLFLLVHHVGHGAPLADRGHLRIELGNGGRG